MRADALDERLEGRSLGGVGDVRHADHQHGAEAVAVEDVEFLGPGGPAEVPATSLEPRGGGIVHRHGGARSRPIGDDRRAERPCARCLVRRGRHSRATGGQTQADGGEGSYSVQGGVTHMEEYLRSGRREWNSSNSSQTACGTKTRPNISCSNRLRSALSSVVMAVVSLTTLMHDRQGLSFSVAMSACKSSGP